MTKNIEVGFGRRNLDANDHFEDLSIETFHTDKVENWGFCGNGTITRNKIARFCGSVERAIGLHTEDQISSYQLVDLLGFYYPPKESQPTIGEFHKEQRELIAYAMFIKKCLDKDGNKLPIEEVAKKFSKMNIVSHCWGAVEVSYVGQYAEKAMKNMGYTPEEIRFAFNQVVHLSYAPYTDHSYFPLIRVNSFIDSQFREVSREYLSAYGKRLDGIDIRYDPPGRFRNHSYPMSQVPIISIYSSQLINIDENSDLHSLIDEHGFELLERNPNWTQGHQSKGAKNADLVSQLFSYSLAYSLAIAIQNVRSDKLIPKSIEELFEILKEFYQASNKDELKKKI